MKSLKNKTNKKLILSPNSFLELELLENSDFRLTCFSNGLDGEQKAVLDIPNPFDGGGREEVYRKIKDIYDIFD